MKYCNKFFPSPKDFLFHIEVFVDRNGKVYLNEAASRLGGGGITHQVELSQGVDLKMEFFNFTIKRYGICI